MRFRFCLLVVLLAASALTVPSLAQANERPKDSTLVAVGLGMALPTYALGVAVHEGSHALAAKAVGATITDYSLIPGFHPRTGKFYFGYVSVLGLPDNRARAWFFLAPKLSDTLLLGTYSILHATDAIPQNHYGQLALVVLATGFWVDFSKDIVAFWDHNDTVKVYNMLGMDTEIKRIPGRLIHFGLSLAMGYAIYRGYDRLFKEDVGRLSQPILLPVWNTAF